MDDLLLVGGGIGGLAAALALGQQGTATELLEQSEVFMEVGAGIGLGPNAMRRLHSWGLHAALQKRGFIPSQLQVRDAADGRQLGQLAMADNFERRYGAPYMTIHRADLHQVLLDAVQAQGLAQLHLSHQVLQIQDHAQGVQLMVRQPGQALSSWQAAAVVGTDGVGSLVRQAVWGAQGGRATRHWAYRCLIPRHGMPAVASADDMGLWLGPGLHVVHYPVRGGEWLNLVVLLESHDPVEEPGWDHHRSPEQTSADLARALRGTCSGLQDLVGMGAQWRAWALLDRDPLQSPNEMARGRVALLGDAAHPMLPYLAQGAGMAIEDAHSLAAHWPQAHRTQAQRLQAYAQDRWPRVARVQSRARRNAQLFHATGAMAWARDLGMKLGGAMVMDMPWLYGH